MHGRMQLQSKAVPREHHRRRAAQGGGGRKSWKACRTPQSPLTEHPLSGSIRQPSLARAESHHHGWACGLRCGSPAWVWCSLPSGRHHALARGWFNRFRRVWELLGSAGEPELKWLQKKCTPEMSRPDWPASFWGPSPDPCHHIAFRSRYYWLQVYVNSWQ